MNYSPEEIKIQKEFLQSQLELQLQISEKLNTQIKEIQEEISKAQEKNIASRLRNNELRFEELSLVGMNSFNIEEMDKVIQIISSTEEAEKKTKKHNAKMMKEISEAYLRAADTVERDKEQLKSEEFYKKDTIRMEENIEATKNKIAELKTHMERMREQWGEELKMNEELYNVLCDIEKEQIAQLNGDATSSAKAIGNVDTEPDNSDRISEDLDDDDESTELKLAIERLKKLKKSS